MPDSLRAIYSYAFKNNEHLKLIPRGYSNNSSVYTIGGVNIYSLGTEAFNNSIDKDCSEILLPASLTKCAQHALVNFNEANSLNTITIGSEEERSNLELTNQS